MWTKFKRHEKLWQFYAFKGTLLTSYHKKIYLLCPHKTRNNELIFAVRLSADFALIWRIWSAHRFHTLKIHICPPCISFKLINFVLSPRPHLSWFSTDHSQTLRVTQRWRCPVWGLTQWGSGSKWPWQPRYKMPQSTSAKPAVPASATRRAQPASTDLATRPL
jgi:hypothetical protein